MKFQEKDIQGLLPNLKGLAGIDPRAELRITEAFRRVYEIIFVRLREQEKDFENKLSTISKLHIEEVGNLRSMLTQPLVASTEQDFLLQSITAGPATQLNANGTILDIGSLIVGEYLRRIGNNVVSGFPVGTTNLKEGILDIVEANLYTTPVNSRTKIRHVLLFNNTAGALAANIIAEDSLGNEFYNTIFNLNSLEKLIITLDLIFPVNYKLNGFAAAAGIEYSLFGIEESTI